MSEPTTSAATTAVATKASAAATLERLTAQGQLIGDAWTSSASAGRYAHHDPATGRLQAEIALGGAAEVTAAVDAATAAAPAWRAMPLEARAAILYRLSDLLAEHDPGSALLNARDNGTPISAMRPGQYAASWVRYYAGWVDKIDGHVVPTSSGLDYVRPEPYGVIGAIVPWNGPMMGMGQKVAPALAAGNTVVAKPPEIAPFGALRFAELALEAGLPPGVLNVVTGGADAGQALVRDPRVGKVSFTGGHVTARAVMTAAAETLKPLALELGGKSANIIFPDADLDTAAFLSVLLGVGLLSGQGCALPT
ncbi:MAG: aldA, partial [Ilumatobacteraceae bacterium]|nr:aldA [Ilumatobacteraceae bacterium]